MLKQLWYLCCTLLLFEAVFGLTINLGKSEMVLMGEIEIMGVLADILRCKIMALPLKYLGLPLGAIQSLTIWDGILECMEKRLAVWKKIYLSKMGRLTYFTSLYPLPTSVAYHKEKIQSDFPWGGLADVFKFHLVNWDVCFYAIWVEVLGIRCLMIFNQRLIGIWFAFWSGDKFIMV